MTELQSGDFAELGSVVQRLELNGKLSLLDEFIAEHGRWRCRVVPYEESVNINVTKRETRKGGTTTFGI